VPAEAIRGEASPGAPRLWFWSVWAQVWRALSGGVPLLPPAARKTQTHTLDEKQRLLSLPLTALYQRSHLSRRHTTR